MGCDLWVEMFGASWFDLAPETIQHAVGGTDDEPVGGDGRRSGDGRARFKAPDFRARCEREGDERTSAYINVIAGDDRRGIHPRARGKGPQGLAGLRVEGVYELVPAADDDCLVGNGGR